MKVWFYNARIQPRPQGAFRWLWRWGAPQNQNQGKAPWGRGWPGSSAYCVVKWHWWKINQILRLYNALPGNEMVNKKCCLSWIETWNTRWPTSLLQRKPQERSAQGLETKALKHNRSLEKRPYPIPSGFVLSRKRWSRIIPKEWKLLAASSKSVHRVTTVVGGRSVKCNAIFAEFEIFRLDLKRRRWSVFPCGNFTVPIYGNTMLRYEQQTLTTLFSTLKSDFLGLKTIEF